MEEKILMVSKIVNIVLNAILCFTAIALNSVTIHATRKTSSRWLPKRLKALILHLAVSDLGVGLLNHPLYIARLVIELQQDVTNFPTFYKIYLFASGVFSYASFFGVLSLSLDRFLAIHVHLLYQALVTFKRVIAALISIWFMSLFLPLIWPRLPRNISFPLFGIIVGGCFIVSGVLNCKIYASVRRHTRQIQSMTVQAPLPQENPSSTMARVNRLRKSAFITIYVYIVFLVCYLPNYCTILFIGAEPSFTVTFVKKYTHTLLLLNSSFNPLIYCLKMRHVRHTVMKMLQNVFSSHQKPKFRK